MDDAYHRKIRAEMAGWQRKMGRSPSAAGRLSKGIQNRLNNMLPDRVHQFITKTIRETVKGVLWGSGITTGEPIQLTLPAAEFAIMERVKWYRRTGSAEGGIAGAGGFALALAEFPVLLATKMKMLFEIARNYGIDTNDYRERLYILSIFQLSYSSQSQRREIFKRMRNWEAFVKGLPEDINQFNWQQFQQDYRDYLDLAKLAQLIPGIGIPIGIIVNYRLMDHLANTAMNAYRMRLLN